MEHGRRDSLRRSQGRRDVGTSLGLAGLHQILHRRVRRLHVWLRGGPAPGGTPHRLFQQAGGATAPLPRRLLAGAHRLGARGAALEAILVGQALPSEDGPPRSQVSTRLAPRHHSAAPLGREAPRLRLFRRIQVRGVQRRGRRALPPRLQRRQHGRSPCGFGAALRLRRPAAPRSSSRPRLGGDPRQGPGPWLMACCSTRGASTYLRHLGVTGEHRVGARRRPWGRPAYPAPPSS